jgi:hypothetical protein
MGKNMKKSRKHMWGGADATAPAPAPAINDNKPGFFAGLFGSNKDDQVAAADKPGFFAGLLGSKTNNQKVTENEKKIEELKEKNKVLEANQQPIPPPIATGTGTGSATTGTGTGSATTGTGSTTDQIQEGAGKRSRRRRGRKSKKSRRSRRHR